jgi:Protein of unknown function (DUF1501)
MNATRRRFLQIAGLASGSMALRSVFSPAVAGAAPDTSGLFLAVYFSGGWDQLLVLDPRPSNAPQYQREAASQADGTGICPAYDLVKDPRVAATLMATGGTGLQKAAGLTFGPGVAPTFLAHAADFSVLRGVFMGTLGHDVGRRYFTTGKFPRGLTASGSSLGTLVAIDEGKDALVPNLAISTEAYNATNIAYASPIGVNTAADVQNLLKPIGTPLDPALDKALLAYEGKPLDCEEETFDQDGVVDLFRGSRTKARSMVSGSTAQLFNFKIPAPTPDIDAVFQAFNITKSADLTGPKGRAAVAAIALAQGVSQAVSLQSASDLDDHFDWGDTHATNLLDGFDALGNLISYLKKSQYKQTTDSVWSRTTLILFSEFARTPNLNGRDGRDHHIASSCLVSGPGLKKGLTLGGTSEKGMTAQNMDFTTGAPKDTGLALRPPDIAATLLQSMGIATDPLSNQSPVPITALLK